MSIFYSHSKNLPGGGRYGSKLLKVHTEGVTQVALSSFLTSISFDIKTDTIQQLLIDVCKFHDLGKYTSYFQNYLLGQGKIDLELKKHSRFGAYALFEKYKQKDKLLAVIAYFLIYSHHSQLRDLIECRDKPSDEIKYKPDFEKQKASVLPFVNVIEEELGATVLEGLLKYPDYKSYFNTVESLQEDKPHIQYYFIINYLFSLLIEADKLDASLTAVYPKQKICSSLVDKLYPPISLVENNKLHKLNQNALRSYVRAKVVAQLDDENILSILLFTLTAPTGIGKTLTALDFALKLREKIRVAENREAQIIYGLPFINIIEQSIEVYNKVIGEQAKVLAHYQYADALEQLSREADEEKNYNQKLMTLDTWQCDIVITTFVQLLQTLIGNRNKLLKKFNHYAGAIIILDEVQTIRLGLQPLIGASLFYLSKFLNARIILMTATKPKIFSLANREILNKEGQEAKPKELLTDYEQVFAQFNRTSIIPLIENKIADEQEFIEKYFSMKWGTDKSCLIVCNTVRRSVDIYNAIKEYLAEKNLINPIYYLSTNIVPVHRLYIIERIKLDLKYGFKPILVSTQCVEAGVDLDFDMGFRDLSPIDSIIQVAGRINRNNNINKKCSPLYIIDFGDCIKIYDKITKSQSRKALRDFGSQINEEKYLELIDSYFDNISDPERSSFEPSREFFKSMKTLKYDGESPYAVSKFKVIEEKNYAISVFVEVDERATACKQAFIKLIHKEITQQEFESYKKDFNQRIIAAPKHLPKAQELETGGETYKLCEGIYLVPHRELNEYYDLITGFNRTKENYSEARVL